MYQAVFKLVDTEVCECIKHVFGQLSDISDVTQYDVMHAESAGKALTQKSEHNIIISPNISHRAPNLSQQAHIHVLTYLTDSTVKPLGISM